MRIFFFFTLLSLSSLSATSCSYEPLYAGTLLADYPKNTPPGYASVQPYLYLSKNYALYGKRWAPAKVPSTFQYQLLLALETGINSFLDISLNINGTYGHFKEYNTFHYGDTVLFFGFQLAQDQKGTHIPDVRLLLSQSFPTGKYDHLDPHKGGADITGSGAYQTTATFICRKVFYLFPCHPFNINLNLYYVLSSKTGVRDLSFYGGGKGTRGTVYPGAQVIGNIGLEYSLNRYWVLGTDLRYEHRNKTPFSGKKGSKPVGLPSSERFSLAPCIEYNWNENLSVSSGAWFSVAGRNSAAFNTYITTVYYYF